MEGRVKKSMERGYNTLSMLPAWIGKQAVLVKSTNRKSGGSYQLTVQDSIRRWPAGLQSADSVEM